MSFSEQETSPTVGLKNQVDAEQWDALAATEVNNNLALTEQDRNSQTSPETNYFLQLNPNERVALVQEVIEAKIRPYLRMEKGDIELYDVQGETVTVLITGACSSCPSVKITMKERVEKTLQESFSPTLRVKAILD